MNRDLYRKISRPFRKNKQTVQFVRLLNLALTGLVYVAYPALMLYVLIFSREHFWRALIVPGSMFVFVSGLRKVIDRPRPYEALEFRPLLVKEKQGESMPSRHIFSVFVIAMTFMYVFGAGASVPFFVIGVVMALLRVIGGVHYPSDVLAGAAIGIISGILGFFVI